MNVRLVDSECRFPMRRRFRFDEERNKGVDLPDKEPDAHKRPTARDNPWRATVKKDQSAYVVKRR